MGVKRWMLGGAARGAAAAAAAMAARRGSAWGSAGRGSPGPERRARLEAAPVVQVRVAGVSFQDRQEAVAGLRAAEGLLLLREPLNEFDPRAVHVRTLGGRSLGYIPRDRTHLFPLPASLAFVAAVGAGDHGLWGLTLCAKPTLPPLTVDFTPKSCRGARLLGEGGLVAQAGPGPSQAMDSAVARALEERGCDVCGAPTQAGTSAADPDLHYEYLEGEVGAAGEEPYSVRIRKFLGVRRLCPACAGVQRLSPEGPGEGEDAALLHLQSCNRWTPQEAEAHLLNARALWKERSGHDWAHDLSVLCS